MSASFTPEGAKAYLAMTAVMPNCTASRLEAQTRSAGSDLG